jgi:hypothetical protein
MCTSLDLLLAISLAAGVAQTPAAQPQNPQTLALRAGDRVVVADDGPPIRGRLAEVTSDWLVLESATRGKLVRMPFKAVQRIDRIGDPLWNGTLIGAGIGGGGALVAMARACSNSGCADTSSSLDPRITLLGALMGAGVGALVDALIGRPKTIYRAGVAQPAPIAAPQATPVSKPQVGDVMIFGRVGWARFTDDEGSLGDGTNVGVGVILPIWRHIGVQVAYDRHQHRRDLELTGPPGVQPSGGFTGTEQLLTAKALFFFRSGEAVRPYAGIGVGFLDSERVSEFPTYVSQPGQPSVLGPPEIFRYHTQGAGLGFAVGVDARVTPRVSLLGDLTLDLNNPDALGSTRLTVGAGWRF